MAGRVTLQPIPLNNSAIAGGTFAASGTGYDTGSPGGSFTAWGSFNGVQFVNNGQMFLWYVNGATAVTAQHLVGRKVAGQLPLFSTVSTVLNTSGSGWIGPWSPQDYTQTDSNAFSGSSAPGGTSLGLGIGAAGVGMTCIDFTAVPASFAVRLYQLVPVSP